MTLTLRITEQDSALIRDYAKLHGMTVSEFVRSAALEKIENEMDLAIYRKAKADFDADPQTFSHDEVGRLLGLK